MLVLKLTKNRKMINYEKDDFDSSLEDILTSINGILNKTGKGFETKEDDDVDEKENKEKRSI